MAIGANWAEIWASVWGPVWSQTAPEPQPEPEVTAPSPAGKSKRRDNRRDTRRLYVEIDGQTFPVANVAQAQALLERAKALANEAAEKAAQRLEGRYKPTSRVRRVALKAPEVTASPELAHDLRVDLTDFRNALARIYSDASVALELRLLLKRQAEEEAAEREREEEFLLLM